MPLSGYNHQQSVMLLFLLHNLHPILTIIINNLVLQTISLMTTVSNPRLITFHFHNSIHNMSIKIHFNLIYFLCLVSSLGINIYSLQTNIIIITMTNSDIRNQLIILPQQITQIANSMY